MKEDILEQLIEDWYVTQSGWFVKHNVKYKPDSTRNDYNATQDSVHSDIDVLAYSAKNPTPDNVHIISCKSWQSGVSLKRLYNIINSEAEYKDKSKAISQKREEWKSFRELVSDKWIKAFVDKIEEETGQRNFTYKIAVTKLKDSKDNYRSKIENSDKIKQRFQKNNSEISIKFIEFKEIIKQTLNRLQSKETTTVEMTEVGRFIQLIKAAGIDVALN